MLISIMIQFTCQILKMFGPKMLKLPVCYGIFVIEFTHVNFNPQKTL